MPDKKVIETREITCEEEGRKARVVLEWQQDGEKRNLVGVHCDNPKFHTLYNWECKWSCWEKIEKE